MLTAQPTMTVQDLRSLKKIPHGEAQVTASAAALLAGIAHANLASYRHWIALSARMLEQSQEVMRIALDACVDGPLAALHAATVHVTAATTDTLREPHCAEPWIGGAAYLGHPAISCLVAEYAADMDSLTFEDGRSCA
jgi:hypothetical protein